MKVLTPYEVECVSGGSWASFWQSVKDLLKSVFGSSNGLEADVNLCTSNGGTANFTVNGSSVTVSAGGGGAVPLDGVVVPITVNASGSQTQQTFQVTCTGAGGNNGGNGSSRGISEN